MASVIFSSSFLWVRYNVGISLFITALQLLETLGKMRVNFTKTFFSTFVQAAASGTNQYIF